MINISSLFDKPRVPIPLPSAPEADGRGIGIYRSAYSIFRHPLALCFKQEDCEQREDECHILKADYSLAKSQNSFDKYRPNYQPAGFASIDDARQWCCRFVDWYRLKHPIAA